MELGWPTVIQASILALCTWYMRRGSKNDAASVRRSTASQTTSNEILERIRELEVDLQIVKRATLKDTTIDHRGPRR